MAAALDCCGNPSSVHAEGRAARRLVEEARAAVARAVGARPANVIFTSGGTEANALALTPAFERRRQAAAPAAADVGDRASLGAAPAGSLRARPIGTDPGRRRRTGRPGRAGERACRRATGRWSRSCSPTTRPASCSRSREAAAMVHAAGGLLHVDAVQAQAEYPSISMRSGADLLTAVGAQGRRSQGRRRPDRGGAVIQLADAADPRRRPGARLRAGTENVAGIAGFGAAAAWPRRRTAAEAARHARACASMLEDGPAADRARYGDIRRRAERLPNTTLFRARRAQGGDRGDRASTSRALRCRRAPPARRAGCSPPMFLRPWEFAAALARGAVRVSLGWATTDADVERFLGAWRKLVGALSKG